MEQITISEKTAKKIDEWLKKETLLDFSSMGDERALEIVGINTAAVIISRKFLAALINTCELAANPDLAKELLRLKNTPASEFEPL